MSVFIPIPKEDNAKNVQTMAQLHLFHILAKLWQTDGETMETETEFIFLGSKVTADGNCSHEIKRCLLLGRKAMTNLDQISSLSRVRLFETP